MKPRVASFRNPKALLTLTLKLVFVALLVAPHLGRLTHPSLYGDDLIRLADLRNMPLGSVLFRPFNEHMAPAFELWTWAIWQVVGGGLRWAPSALTLASVLPFALLLGAVGVWLRQELRSRTAALLGVAVLGLSPLSVECVSWFSASSFSWAVLGIVIGLTLVGREQVSHVRIRAVGLSIVSLVAPWFSAIGVLAAPLISIRAAMYRTANVRDRAVLVFAPWVGLMGVLLVVVARRHDRVIGAGVQQAGDHVRGLLLASAAPMARLVPVSLAGVELDRWLPPALLAGLTVVIGLAILWRGRREPIVVAALCLIAGGYLLTYPFRNVHTERWLLAVERFHLVPLVGLAALFGWATRRWLARADADPIRSWGTAVLVGALLLAIHARRIERVDAIYRSPEQAATLAAIDHLAQFPASRSQLLRALDPVWSAWFQREFNGLWLLPPSNYRETRDDASVRREVLSFLSLSERRALWGGMDVTRFARRTDKPNGGVVGRRVSVRHARFEGDEADRPVYHMTGWPADVLFQFDPGSKPSVLVLDVGATRTPLEIGWRSRGQDWSNARSVRFQPSEAGEWHFELSRWPHWSGAEPGSVHEIRVRFVSTPLALSPPRLVVP